MRAGKLRHQVQLQSVTDTADGGGGVTKVWTTYATVWGELKPVDGSEALEAGKLEGKVTHEYTTRYITTAVLAQHRVLYGTRTFNIRSVLNTGERNRELKLALEEGVAV